MRSSSAPAVSLSRSGHTCRASTSGGASHIRSQRIEGEVNRGPLLGLRSEEVLERHLRSRTEDTEMSYTKSLLMVIFMLASYSTAQATTYTFSSFDYPGGMPTVANGINNNGDIVGGYRPDPDFLHDNAYLRDSGGAFTTINLPVSGAFTTVANGINDSGTIVGYFADDTLAHHGFIDMGGSFTIFQVPGEVRPNNNTEANGINNGGAVVGHYADFTIDRGFMKAGVNITTINAPFFFR